MQGNPICYSTLLLSQITSYFARKTHNTKESDFAGVAYRPHYPQNTYFVVSARKTFLRTKVK